MSLLLALAALFVDGCLKGAARNELRELLGRNLDGFAGVRVATGASRTSLKLKGAETDECQGVILLDGGDNFFCHCRKDAAGLGLGNAVFGGNFVNQRETIHSILLGNPP